MDKPNRKRNRLSDYDYSTAGAYFITVCTQERKNFFWKNVGATVVQQLKGVVTKKVGFSLWQKGFYDHVVRGEKDYLEIWDYIDGNPGKWLEDKYYN